MKNITTTTKSIKSGATLHDKASKRASKNLRDMRKNPHKKLIIA
mgnify:FL=1